MFSSKLSKVEICIQHRKEFIWQCSMKRSAPNNLHNLAIKQKTSKNAFQDPWFCHSFILSWLEKNAGFQMRCVRQDFYQHLKKRGMQKKL